MNAISAYLASASPSVGCLGDCTLDDDGPEAAAPSDEFRRLPPDDAPPPRETVFERMAFKTIYVQRARLKPDTTSRTRPAPRGATTPPRIRPTSAPR